MLTIRVITRLQDLTGDCTFTSLTNGDLVKWNGTAFVNQAQSGLTGVAHANLTGLTSGDDHTQYALLAGRSGGQTFAFDTASGATTGIINTTAHATKGRATICGITFDQANTRLGIGITPTVALDVTGTIRVNTGGTNVCSILDAAGTSCQIISASPYVRFSFYPANTRAFIVHTGGVGISNADAAPTTPSAALHVIAADSGTSNILVSTILDHQSSGTPAAGFGVGITLKGKSSTTNAQDMAKITTEWVVATHASRTSRLKLLASDSAGDREGVRVESNGTVALLSFFGATAVVQPAGVTAALATRTAGATYGATEQTMLQEAHDMARTLAVAIRALGLAA